MNALHNARESYELKGPKQIPTFNDEIYEKGDIVFFQRKNFKG